MCHGLQKQRYGDGKARFDFAAQGDGMLMIRDGPVHAVAAKDNANLLEMV